MSSRLEHELPLRHRVTIIGSVFFSWDVALLFSNIAQHPVHFLRFIKIAIWNNGDISDVWEHDASGTWQWVQFICKMLFALYFIGRNPNSKIFFKKFNFRITQPSLGRKHSQWRPRRRWRSLSQSNHETSSKHQQFFLNYPQQISCHT